MAGQGEGAPGGVLLPLGVGLPPFLVGLGLGRGKEVEEKKEGGAPPPFPCPIRTQGGAWPALLRPSSLSTKAHGGPLVPPGGPVTPLTLRFYPKPLGTLPVSE